ncbi:MAG TPA: 30S ribosomal protein S12 methylthiotransferase RimO, partial [candidate division Zixibacteria bacterium]|nr:30S ribosomal protein S12 methylthiotransferase RimO [candidate division Zixibacteria bacterium]
GETDDQFGELYDFVADVRFDRLGAFAYSREEGSAAALMPDQVPVELARERLEALEELQRGIAEERNRGLIGGRIEALVDRAANGSPAQGRTRGDCPEIDQVVYFQESRKAPLHSGDLIEVEVTGVDDLDLVGRPVGFSAARPE